MPVYEYRCEGCGWEFERLLSREQAEAPQACPKCKSTKTVRKLSTFCSRSTGAGGSSSSGCG